jgi:hypothetical protein
MTVASADRLEASPTAAVLDSQSVKPAEKGVEPRAAFRTINHELHSAISASCVCRKSTEGFFLWVE